jgi:hypothetical protein
MLTERKAELLALEHRIEKRIRRTWVMFAMAVILSNIITGAVAVTIALSLAHSIWKLHP